MNCFTCLLLWSLSLYSSHHLSPGLLWLTKLSAWVLWDLIPRVIYTQTQILMFKMFHFISLHVDYRQLFYQAVVNLLSLTWVMEPLWVWAAFSGLTFTRIYWHKIDRKIGMFLCMRYALVSVDTSKSYALGPKCMLKPNVSHALTSHCIQMWLASTETQCVSVDVSSSALCPPLMSKVSRDLSLKTKSIISYEAFAIFPFLVSSKQKKLLLVLWNFYLNKHPVTLASFFCLIIW